MNENKVNDKASRSIFLLDRDDISYFLITKDIDSAYESFIKEEELKNLDKKDIKVIPIFDNNVYYIKTKKGDKQI